MTDRHSVATVRDWLLEPATDAGIHLADETDGWTYRSYPELAELTLSVATLMREHGVPDGAGVCVIMPTGFPCVAAFYAVWACGGVFTPVAPPMFGDIDQYVAHVAAVLTRADPFAVVTSPELDHLIRRAMTDAGRTDEPLVLRPDAITAADPLTEFGTPAEIALLQFTSGSTGTPRGVQVSSRRAMRYRSVASIVMRSPSNSTCTPVRMGSASLRSAATETCATALVNRAPSTVPLASGEVGREG